MTKETETQKNEAGENKEIKTCYKCKRYNGYIEILANAFDHRYVRCPWCDEED